MKYVPLMALLIVATLVSARADPQPQSIEGADSAAGKLIAARQANAENQWKGRPSVWMLIPPAETSADRPKRSDRP